MLSMMGNFPSLCYTALVYCTGTHNMNRMGMEMMEEARMDEWEGAGGNGKGGEEGRNGE